MSKPSLIAIDWGTSNLRASLIDAQGRPLENRDAPGGIMAVKNGAFAQALLALCGDWMSHFDCPLIASGMIGSRQGWKEATYLDCPADARQAASALVAVEINQIGELLGKQSRLLYIVPGLRYQEAGGQFDVMRGEETQIWGAAIEPGNICVLPGTHSKWAWLGHKGDITGFRTYMTGELYSLLTTYGILGRLMQFGSYDKDAFVAGAKLGIADHAHASHVIFMARTAGLMGLVKAEGLPDYLSGLLIGIELGSAIFASSRGKLPGVVLIGDDDLCGRYELAFELLGCTTTRASSAATTIGQTTIARAAGLMGKQS